MLSSSLALFQPHTFSLNYDTIFKKLTEHLILLNFSLSHSFFLPSSIFPSYIRYIIAFFLLFGLDDFNFSVFSPPWFCSLFCCSAYLLNYLFLIMFSRSSCLWIYLWYIPHFCWCLFVLCISGVFTIIYWNVL